MCLWYRVDVVRLSATIRQKVPKGRMEWKYICSLPNWDHVTLQMIWLAIRPFSSLSSQGGSTGSLQASVPEMGRVGVWVPNSANYLFLSFFPRFLSTPVKALCLNGYSPKDSLNMYHDSLSTNSVSLKFYLVSRQGVRCRRAISSSSISVYITKWFRLSCCRDVLTPVESRLDITIKLLTILPSSIIGFSGMELTTVIPTTFQSTKSCDVDILDINWIGELRTSDHRVGLWSS